MIEQQMQSPFLIGKRVYLRPLEPDQDAHQLAQWYNNQDLRRYILTPYIMNDSRYREFISGLYKSSNLVACGIASKKENKLVGAIGLRNIDHVYQSAELYMIKIDPQEQGKGYGTEATQLILHYGFMELNLNRIESLDVEENISAWKVDEKLGFQLEGLKREAFFRNGRPYNVRIYSLLRREYRELFLNSPVYADIREMLSLEEG